MIRNQIELGRKAKLNAYLLRSAGLLVLGAAFLGGCAAGVPDAEVVPANTPKEPVIPVLADAGVPTETDDAAKFDKQVQLIKFSKRKDPFALKSNEASFDQSQSSLRVFNEIGGFSMQYNPPPEEAPSAQDIPEPQPYRRLAGVVVGDSVLALIDMGDGRPVEIIRPGQQIPNSEWTVASIDTEKAVLTRKGNQTPRRVTVKLESAPPGAAGAVGGAGGFTPGSVPGGGGNQGEGG